MRTTVKEIVEILREEGFDVDSYSGRCMYGARCVSVDVDDIGEALRIGGLLVHNGISYLAVNELAKDMRWDSMGKGYVMYWPGLKVTEEHAALFPVEIEEDEE